MLAPGQSKSPRKRRGEKEAQPSGRTRRALAPPAWFGSSPPAPLTHPLRPPPAPALLAVQRGTERRAAAGPGAGTPGARRKRARDAGGSAHLAVGVPVRPAAALPRPRVVPGAGQPRARRMDGRRRRPAPVLQGSRCAGVPRPAARAASGWGARGELWLGVCDRESRDPRSLRPSSLPHSRPPAVIWSRSCRPLAAASGSTGPQPTRTSQRAPY